MTDGQEKRGLGNEEAVCSVSPLLLPQLDETLIEVSSFFDRDFSLALWV
jgi:hypothetical protein